MKRATKNPSPYQRLKKLGKVPKHVVKCFMCKGTGAVGVSVCLNCEGAGGHRR